MNPQIRVIALDLDGVLFDGPSAAYPIAEAVGIKDKFIAEYSRIQREGLSLEESVIQGSKIWKGIPTTGVYDSVVKWLKLAVEKRGFKRTWFLSPNALCYGGKGRKAVPEKLEQLLQGVTSINGLDEVFFGAFPSEVRPEFVTKDLLKMMRECPTRLYRLVFSQEVIGFLRLPTDITPWRRD